MEFAVIETGGKQYKVSKGDEVAIEKIEGEENQEIALEHVLAASSGDKNLIGAPYLKGAKVKAKILSQYKDDKVIVFKKKRRKNYRRKAGHRQELTQIEILDIALGAKAK